MALTPDQVKDVIAADAAETKAAKAALIVAQRGAMEAKIQFNFLQAFTGTEGVTRGAVFYACQANWSVLYAYMEAAGLSKTNFDDVVIAFYAVKDSLATDATAGHVATNLPTAQRRITSGRLARYPLADRFDCLGFLSPRCILILPARKLLRWLETAR